MKKLALTVFVLSVLTALFLRACVPVPSMRIISDFERDKESFVVVAEYIESFAWESYGADQGESRISAFGFRDRTGTRATVSHSTDIENVTIPEADKQVERAVRLLYHKLGYASMKRTFASKNTIIFEAAYPSFCWDVYFNQGVCYAIDGGEPTPEYNYDYCTENIVPLGGDWYYWCGHCYYG